MKPKKLTKKIALLLVLSVCLTLWIPSVCAHAEKKTISETFSTFTWEYQYDDDYFQSDPDEYNHEFAKLSLGFALAGFRDPEHPDAQDDYLLPFFEDTGFTEPQTDLYKTTPTADSICYGIAQKKIGDTTVIACSVCGGDYGLEWASNLTVGDTDRSVGFEDASQKVQKGLNEYLKKYSLKKNLRLWITGYSRGAAAANIAAADCTDGDVFDAVYCYTFGTPFTTRNPKNYKNIFNIVQKEDIVPKIPLEDWGYKRYGIDRYILSPETDSDYEEVMEKAAELYREKTGSEMVTNAEINYQLRILMDYLLALVPNSGIYTEYLQPLVVDFMTQDEGTTDALKVMLEVLKNYSVEDKQVGEELKAMRDYLGTLIGYYYLQDNLKDMPPQLWDPKAGVENLFNAHRPNEYLAFLNASDDPEKIFSDHLDYIRLIIYAKADTITISDGEKVVKEIKDKKEYINGEERPYSYPDADCYDEKTVITLPSDKSMEVTVHSGWWFPQTVTYTGLRFSGNTLRAKNDDVYSYILAPGSTLKIRTSTGDRAIEPTKSDHTNISFFLEPIYSPTTAMRLENNEVTHLTISGFVNRLLLVIVILILQMIASIILWIIRKKKNRGRNPIVALIWHAVIAAMFAIFEVAMWYFVPIFTIAKMIPGTLTCVVLISFAFKGAHGVSKNWKAFWIMTAALIVYVILESLLIGDFEAWKAYALLAKYAAFMTAAFLFLWQKPKSKRIKEEESEDEDEKTIKT